jgi:hypothetical protein
MDIIQTIKNYERVGFSREQAEIQVKTMVDLKKGLATSEELKSLEKKNDVRFDAIDARFDAMDARFAAIDKRFEAIDIRLDAQDTKIEAIPFKTTIYLIGVLGAYQAVISYWPILEKWLSSK